MLLLALTALTAVATRPEPQGNQAEWVRYSDIPRSEWSHATITSFDLTIDRTGHSLKCEITHSSGSKALDDVVCASWMRRSRYKPALDANGEPLPSIVRDHVIWNPDGGGENQADPEAPDIVIQLDKSVLKTKRALVQVIEIIAPSGRIESCAPEKGQSQLELADAACSALRRPEFASVVRDETGAAVRGARAFNVAFVASPQAGILIR